MSPDAIALTRGRLFSELLRLAWPMTLSMLSYSVMTFVGTLFVGRLGPAALGAVGLGGALSFALAGFGMGALRSVKVAVSQLAGAGQAARVIPILASALVMAALIGAVSAAASMAAAPLAAQLAGGASGELAGRYVATRGLGAPLLLIATALREARFGLGDSRSPMLAALTSNLANLLADAVFIVGLGWGVPGAAWAAVLGQFVDAAVLAAIQARDGLGLMRAGRRDAVWLLRLGLPLGLQFLLEIGAFTLLVGMLARAGEIQVAAHQIALQVVHFAFLPALGLGEAASVLVGRAVGAAEDGRVKRIARRAALVAMLYSLCCAVTFALGGERIARAFTSDAAVVNATRGLLLIAAGFTVFDAANIVARCALRGTGDVSYPAAAAVVTAWVCTPPLTLLLAFQLELGALGGWLAISVEVLVGAAILWWRLESGAWHAAAELSRCQARVAPPSWPVHPARVSRRRSRSRSPLGLAG